MEDAWAEFRTAAAPQSDPWAEFRTSKTTMGNAVSDIIPEIKNAASENIDTIKNAFTNRGEKGVLQGPIDTGKAILAIPGLIASPITGAARSILGHGLATTEHAIGSVIAPDIAAKDNPQQMYETAKGDADLAMSAVAPKGVSPVGIGTVKPPALSSPELKARARGVYNDPAIKAIDIPPSDAAALGAKIENDLATAGYRPTPGNAPGTIAEVKNITPGPGVSAVKVDDLSSARRALGITAKQLDPATGLATPDAAAATRAIGHINDFLDQVAPALKGANADYAAAKSAERLDYRMVKAERRAAKSGTGGNLENTMRQEADKIPNRGLTAQEQAARDRIVFGSPVRNALRTTGKLGVDGGMSLLIHMLSAAGSGGSTIPVAIGGTAARKVGELLTRLEMRRLNETIRSRAPSSQAQIPQTQQISRGAKAVAAALLAKRQGVPLPLGIMPANADQGP